VRFARAIGVIERPAPDENRTGERADQRRNRNGDAKLNPHA
jgi:hypothetical protein